MKIFKIILLNIILATALYSSNEIMRIGIYYPKLFTSLEEAKLAGGAWEKQTKLEKYKVKSKAFYYDDPKKIMSDYTNKKVDVLVGDLLFYYNQKDKLKSLSQDAWILSSSEQKFQQFYLLKNKKSKISLKNFSNAQLVYQDEMHKIWLEDYLNKNKLSQDPINNSKKLTKPKKVIYNVFFNKNTISVAKKDLYDLMVDLNPQVGKKLEVLKKSKLIFPSSLCFTISSMSKDMRETFILMAENAKDVKSDYGIISFIDVQKVFRVNEEDFKKLDAFFKAYYKSKK